MGVVFFFTFYTEADGRNDFEVPAAIGKRNANLPSLGVGGTRNFWDVEPWQCFFVVVN